MKIINSFTVIFLTGLVIKLMDDYLDQEIDKINGRKTIAIRLQRGIVPYTLILFTFSALLNHRLTIALFWASYVIGMGFEGSRLPTGLKAYQEVLIMLVFGFVVFDYKEFLFTLMIIFFIQLIDDYIDYYRERYINRDNFINYLGRLGTIFLAILSLLIAISISWQRSLLVIVTTPIIVWLLHR